MEEALLAYAPVILAVALAVILRLRRSHKEASKKIAALRKELVVLQHRNHELEQDLGQALKQAPKQAHDRLTSPSLHPSLEEDTRHDRAATYFAGHPQIEEAFHRLQALKAALPLDGMVEEKYVAELNSIIESLEQATGMDLGRWLGIPPSEEQQPRVRQRARGLLRFKILSLEAFCNYQVHYAQRWSRFLEPLPRDARRIH